MEKNKPMFTPGPWEAHLELDGLGDYFEVWRTDKRDDMYGRVICHFTESPQESIHDIANVCLISAAPEMYDFIHFFETFAGQAYLRILPDEAGKKIYEEAVRLCKKARGEK